MSNSFGEEENGEEHEQEQELEPPTHNPSAPPHELFEISTAVDPGYVISLIRKLLPSNEEPKTEGIQENSIDLPENGFEGEAMDSSENHENVDEREEKDDKHSQGGSAQEETWEECGCILWDLSANEEHAQFMVQNLILEVLLANLMVSRSSRVTEISLGIIGNLACHEITRKQIASTNGLVKVIVDQLLLDDVPCLCEACRVMSLCLQGSGGVIWAEALQSAEVLSRILWIAENALNPQLIEKSVGLLLAALESQQEVAAVLLPHMMKLDVSSLLVNLLAFEMSKFRGERMPERYPLLDLILRTLEALSVIDDYSQEICLNKVLVLLLKEFFILPDKIEVASSCVTAAVLIANILTDANDLSLELSQDLSFLQGLFDVFPFASEDTEAQNAIWSIIAKLLTIVQQNDMNATTLHLLISIILSKTDLLEDEILVPQLDNGEPKIAGTGEVRFIVMKCISDILIQWKNLDNETRNTVSVADYHINEADVDKMLNHFSKAAR